ncbi:hypothetical protein MBCUT_11160 [Methanobrevibacter cuticularis]|uniref:Uncharacterized protein n=1 Tax=Methanobrevibacter cuticularis TaxID=47311 RepID=A0A166DWU4_9EURY|nr:hypothetical protein [Methanobrevibacter cuticularis]KZX16035.1 hypothetical protein MBCUT_11160 [Methanobrevibacter cuticularis]
MEIHRNGVKYEFLIRLASQNDKLICFGGSGRVNQKKHDLPFFQRHSWQSSFEESVIYFADPTFYIDSKLVAGWFMGTKDDWYLKTICEIIKKITENRNIDYENILHYGTSSSGFAAVMLATMIKGSTALVGNFNSDIFKVHLQSTIDNLKKFCFDGLDEDTIVEKYGYRVNVVELFKKMDYIPPIIYHVNANSDVDLIGQCIPFIESLGKENIKSFENDVEIIICHDDWGHKSRVTFIEAYPLIRLVLERKIYKYYTSSRMQPISYKEINKYKQQMEKLRNVAKKQAKTIKKFESWKLFKFYNKIIEMKHSFCKLSKRFKK